LTKTENNVLLELKMLLENEYNATKKQTSIR